MQRSPSLLRPPIVAVLGHVDHGKTTLLDTIRKTTVALGEHGGITQHIGAYQINLEPRTITFIDTPGHEAFAKMRSRGAVASDIAILVIAADDSVKPQTVESIHQIKKASVPMIVAVNKIDLPTAKVDKVKSDLAKHGVQVEGFGGDVPIVPISAKQGTGIKELLDLILLVSDMKGSTSEPHAPFEGIVIETHVHKGKGMVATVIVKKGTLVAGSPLYERAAAVGKVRAMYDENGEVVKEALPSKPVEVLGFRQLPAVGSVLRGVARRDQAVPLRSAIAREASLLPDFLKLPEEEEKRELKLVLKADTAGSLEAIVASLPEAATVIFSGIGDIAESDILTAKASGAIVVGFQVKIPSAVLKLAQAEKVICRTYMIIYELLSELEDAAEGLVEVLVVERELGRGQIIAEFPYEDSRIAGTKVASGRLARGDSIKIMRGEEEIAQVRIKSMRRGKEDVTKVEEGVECGIIFDKKVDFAIQDAIIAATTG